MRIKLNNPMTEEDFGRLKNINIHQHIEHDKEGNVYICLNDEIDDIHYQKYLNEMLANWIESTSGKNIIEGNETFQKQLKRYCDAKPYWDYLK